MPKRSRPHVGLHIHMTCFMLSRRFTVKDVIEELGVNDNSVRDFIAEAERFKLCRPVGVEPRVPGRSGTQAIIYEFSNPFAVNSETLQPFVDMAPTTDVKLTPSTTPSEHLHAPSQADSHTEAPAGAR